MRRALVGIYLPLLLSLVGPTQLGLVAERPIGIRHAERPTCISGFQLDLRWAIRKHRRCMAGTKPVDVLHGRQLLTLSQGVS